APVPAGPDEAVQWTAAGMPPGEPETIVAPRVLAELATGLWRLRTKATEPGTDVARPEMRAVRRQVEWMWGVLTDAGLDVQSHDQQPTDPGLSLDVLASQPVPGLDRERVLETVRPTVYLAGRVIQRGEVIIGTVPADSPGARADNPAGTTEPTTTEPTATEPTATEPAADLDETVPAGDDNQNPPAGEGGANGSDPVAPSEAVQESPSKEATR
ncbi:MAG TPA: hypothetical protein VIJ23_06935, partial [Mycobacterium sp.]